MIFDAEREILSCLGGPDLWIPSGIRLELVRSPNGSRGPKFGLAIVYYKHGLEETHHFVEYLKPNTSLRKASVELKDRVRYMPLQKFLTYIPKPIESPLKATWVGKPITAPYYELLKEHREKQSRTVNTVDDTVNQANAQANSDNPG